MNPSLSVLLPVRNAQATLQANVQKVLEILPELTNRFEVLIIDDGSTDATCEVAYELARDYPQLAVVRHAEPLGWAAAVASEAAKTRGDFLMIHSGGDVEPDDIVGLWRLRQGIAAAAIAKAKAAQAGKSWRLDDRSPAAGEPPAENKQSARLLGGLGIHARAPRSNLLLIHRQQVGQLEQSLVAASRSGWRVATPHTRGQRSDGVQRPGFLKRLRTFALGE